MKAGLKMLPFFFLAVLLLTLTLALILSPRSGGVEKKLVLLVSLDGFGSDLIGPQTPFINELLQNKATDYTLELQSLQQSETMPAHISMLTGLTQEHHGFYRNSVDAGTAPLTRQTILDRAAAAGYHTNVLVTKEKLLYLAGGKQKDNVILVDSLSSGALTAIDNLVEPHTDKELAFIHLRDLDTMGHQYGWGGPEQRQALVTLDQNLRLIINDLNSEFSDYQRYYVITADHGGEGREHSSGCAACRKIPLIVYQEPTPDKEIPLLQKHNIQDTACVVLDIMDLGREDIDCN